MGCLGPVSHEGVLWEPAALVIYWMREELIARGVEPEMEWFRFADLQLNQMPDRFLRRQDLRAAARELAEAIIAFGEEIRSRC